MTDFHKKPRRKQTQNKASSRAGKPADALWLYGRHAALAALRNPERKIKRIVATRNGAEWLAERLPLQDRPGQYEDAKPHQLEALLHDGAVHQGIALEVEDLPSAQIEDICIPADINRPILVLDQITDPQNIGALFRTAVAFHARAIVVQERRTPPLAGALAKAAAGGLEVLPCIKVVNIARALRELQDIGYLTVGLAGEIQDDIHNLPKDQPIALVMGAEGPGLRQLVRETCERLVRISIAPEIESLNVSTAAAVALYEINRPML